VSRSAAPSTGASQRSPPGPGPDRPLAPDLEAAERLVGSGALVQAVEAEMGELL
jgi:histidine ammonia-lyase